MAKKRRKARKVRTARSDPLAKLAVAFAEAYTHERSLHADHATAKATLDEVAVKLRSIFEKRGISSLTALDVTAYLHRTVYANLVGGEASPESVEALRSAGLDFLVQECCRTSKLGAWVREHDENPATGLPALPPDVAAVVNVGEKFDVRGRRK